jgi:hypothetical protein
MATTNADGTWPDYSWTEPESAANTDFPPIYPYNHVTQTESGHSFEMDDTPERERIRLQHRIGTFIEMHPNGDEVHKVYGDGYEITINNKNVLIKGACTIRIEGDANIQVMGDKNEQIMGDYNLDVGGNMLMRCRGDDGMDIRSDNDMNITSNPNFGGSLSLSAGDHILINSDLSVSGDIAVDNLSANFRVDAGTGMGAGFLGFVTDLGGVAVGTGIAIPGEIFAAGSVNAPFGNFGIMDAVLMTDAVNSSIYDSHFHIGFKGPTGPPLPPFAGL